MRLLAFAFTIVFRVDGALEIKGEIMSEILNKKCILR